MANVPNTQTDVIVYEFTETELISLGISAADIQAVKDLPSSQTGTGAMVLATSPTLVTPTLGVAAATSVNKVAITAPATSATLTIANGKTLTASNTLTLTGTDASSVAFGTGGTVAYSATAASFTTTDVGVGGYLVSATKVIGAQGAAVADASGGATVDAEARTAINDLLARLRAHGLIAT